MGGEPLREPDVDRLRARLHHAAEICSKDGKITGLRVDTIADHGAFDSTAQPTKFPAGFFHIVCGSYDLEAAHVKVKAVYTNKAPGGSRLPLLVPDHRSRLPRRAHGRRARAGDEGRSDRPADAQLHPSEQFPYETTTGWTYDSGEYAKAMKVAMEIAGYEAAPRAGRRRARGELMGIGVSFFTEGVGAGPRKHMDILGLSMNDGADLRVHPSGKAVVSISAQTQGQGHETTFAQIVAEELGIRRVEVRHGDTDKFPYGLGTYGSRSTPVSGGAVAIVSRKVRDKARLIAATMLEDAARGPRVGEGPLVRQGRPRAGRDDRGDRGSGLQRRADARRHRGRARRPGDLRPAEPHVSLRRVHRRRRHRPDTAQVTIRRFIAVDDCGCGSTRWLSKARSTAGWPRSGSR